MCWFPSVTAGTVTHDSIHKITLSNATVTHWPVNDRPIGLSLTCTHSVLVTCNLVRRIKEFSTDGQLLHVLTLPHDVVSPWHTVQLSSGQFIACHGFSADPLHRVCLIGSNGSVLKLFGGPQGSDRQHFNTLNRIAVVRNEFIFVADMNNYRVSFKLCRAYVMLYHVNSLNNLTCSASCLHMPGKIH